MHRSGSAAALIALLWASASAAQERVAADVLRLAPFFAAADTVPSHVVGASVLAAAPMPSHPVAASVEGASPDPLLDAAMAALPPPPKKVVLETIYYGTVTVDHEAHLARRASCKGCHGPGQVHKIGRLPAKQAHEACRGCHQQLARGPTDCRGCHVMKPADDTAVASAEAESGKVALAAAATPVAKATPAVPAALAAASPAGVVGGGPGAATAPLSTLELPGPLDFRRSALAGLSVVAGGGRGAAAGLSATIRIQEDGLVVSNSLEWSGGGSRGRMLGLLGAGAVIPVRDRWTAHVLGVGGFDAIGASFLPVLGARAGCEWVGGLAWVQSIDVSLTGVADLRRADGPSGERLGGFVTSLAVSAGMDLRSRP